MLLDLFLQMKLGRRDDSEYEFAHSNHYGDSEDGSGCKGRPDAGTVSLKQWTIFLH